MIRSSSSFLVGAVLGVTAILIAGAATFGCNGVLGNEAIVFDLDAADLDASAATESDAAPGDTAPDTGPPACAGTIPCERIVFVTRTLHSGNLGGVAGADAFCQAAADAKGSLVRGRSFAAWLSAPFNVAGTRLAHGTMPYRRTDGHMIAANWDELVSGTIREPIDRDEKGMPITQATAVWTGTLPTGGLYTPNCEDWTIGSEIASGALGITTARDMAWTANTEQSCSTMGALYCFER